MQFDNRTEFEFKGLAFVRYVIQDDDNGAPWDESDGHGPVRIIGRNESKRPGERPMHSDGFNTWLYDWAGACQKARADGWDAAPYDAPGRIERAVQADFDFLRGWLRDDWGYVGVCVCLASADAEDPASCYAHALWRIESNSGEYLQEVAQELAGDILHEFSKAELQREADMATCGG